MTSRVDDVGPVAAGACWPELVGELEGTVWSERAAAVRVDAVQHEPGQRHAVGLEPFDEERRLAQRVALRRRHHDERGPAVLERGVGPLGPLAEAAEHRLERGEERLHVTQQPGAEEFRDRRREHRHAGASSSGRTRGRRPGSAR